MARQKSQPRVKSLGIDAAIVCQQFDQFAPFGARLLEGPLHQLLTDASAAAMAGDANILDQRARSTLRAYSRQDAELQAADHDAVSVLRHHKPDVSIALDPFECLKIGRWQ